MTRLDIFIVDDEHVIRQGLKRIIERTGIAHRIVGEASDGGEALEKLRRTPCDLLVADIQMPVMDGLELISAIRELNLGMEIVILSGYGEFTYARDAIRLGVSDYILKPMNPELVQGVLLAVQAKLSVRKRSLVQQSRCFSHCGDRIERLAEALWQLDEESMRTELASIEAEVGGLELGEHEKTHVYAEFVSWTVAWLESKSRGHVPLRKALAQGACKEGTDLDQSLSAAVACLAGEIRFARNWAKRAPIREAVDYVESHFDDPELTLEKLLHITGLSATYFYELFKAETGQNFKSFLIQLRVNQAKRLLDSSGFKSYEVGEKVGYLDYPHFARLFKKCVGTSPAEYKRRMEGGFGGISA